MPQDVTLWVGNSENDLVQVGPSHSLPMADAITGAGVGAPADAESTSGNGSLIAILKNVRTRLANALTMKLVDGVTTTNIATIAALHNADNQSLPVGTTYGLLTGGVAQLKNVQGNLDRQTETGTDGIPALGIATGTQQLASPFATTIATSITLNVTAQAVTPASMTNIQIGSILNIDTSTNKEAVVVTATSGTTFTAVFTKNHTGPGIVVAGFIYNQARDASVGDLVAPTGLSPSATYLYNSFTGLYELDRSAAGELDGAKGAGTAVAAEYEWNGGGPLTNAGAISGLAYDRARNVQGKGVGTTTLNGATSAGATSVVLTAVVGLNAGQQIVLDRGTGNKEVAYVTTSYTPGSTTVALQSALQFAHSNSIAIDWDITGSVGPGLSGFTAAGVGIEEEALYDPVTDKFYLERSATQDGVAGANIVLEAPAIWNGTTFDRVTGAAARGMDVTLKTLIAGEDQTVNVMKVEERFSSAYISTATTTTIKSGSGMLHMINVEGGTAGTIIGYDNTAASGTILFSYDSTNALASYHFDVTFATGLTIITSAATKVSASYR